MPQSKGLAGPSAVSNVLCDFYMRLPLWVSVC